MLFKTTNAFHVFTEDPVDFWGNLQQMIENYVPTELPATFNNCKYCNNSYAKENVCKKCHDIIQSIQDRAEVTVKYTRIVNGDIYYRIRCGFAVSKYGIFHNNKLKTYNTECCIMESSLLGVIKYYGDIADVTLIKQRLINALLCLLQSALCVDVCKIIIRDFIMLLQD